MNRQNGHKIEVRGLKKDYSRRSVVDNLDIDMKTGEIVGLLGPNGAGKTTTFYMVMGIIKQNAGTISFDGRRLETMPMYKRARVGMGYLPQEPSIFKKLTVRDNIRAVMEIKGYGSKVIKQRADNLIDEFSLNNIASNYGHELSGGQRRRTEIARTIATDPVFMLFDEPFTGVDPIAITELKKTLNYLKGKGLGILITDHNVRETLSITDRAYIINRGKVLDEGTPDKIIENQEVRESYLGKEFTL